jgi:hypothetical protein
LKEQVEGSGGSRQRSRRCRTGLGRAGQGEPLEARRDGVGRGRAEPGRTGRAKTGQGWTEQHNARWVKQGGARRRWSADEGQGSRRG